jgi:outer membrane protein assembly factor BamA
MAVPLWAQQGADSIKKDSCFVLEKILITGKRKTKDKIILRELNVKEGDCISNIASENEREINLLTLSDFNRKRLMSLKLFNDVEITWTESATGGYWMNIKVIDRFPIIPDVNFEFADRNFNVWWTEQHHDLNRLNLGITLHDNNFRGNHEIVSVTGQLGYTQKIGLSYARPFVDKNQKHGFGASFFGLQNREIAYKTVANKLEFLRSDNNFMQRRFDASVWYTYRPKYATTHMALLAFHHYWISDTIAQLNPDYLGNGHTEENILELKYRFEYNAVDNWEYPLTGHRFIGELDNNWAIGNNTFQTAINLHFDKFYNPFPKWYLAFIFRSKVSFSQSQPWIFRRNLGYDFDYVRGYEYYVIDGSRFALGRVDLKRELLNKRIKLPIRYFEVIPIRIYAKAFADVGIGDNKYAKLDGDQLNNKGLYSCGFGIDLITLYDIKVRIEYTVNRLNEKGLYLHRNGE